MFSYENRLGNARLNQEVQIAIFDPNNLDVKIASGEKRKFLATRRE